MRVGDKVRYVKHVHEICPERLGIVKHGNHGLHYDIGDEAEITEVLHNLEEYRASVQKQYGESHNTPTIFPFLKIGQWGYGPATCFELVDPPATHRCTCPDINFAVNGIGCQCGGV